MDREKMLRDFSTYLSVEKGLSQLSIKAYISDVRIFLDSLGSRDPSRITESDVVDFIKERREKGDKDTTLVRRLSSVHALISFLNLEGVLRSDPMEMLKRPRLEQRLPKAEDRQNIELLLNAPYNVISDKRERGKLTENKYSKLLRDAAMLEVAYSTGLRATELVNLKVGDVDLNGMYLRTKGKRGRERTIPIGEVAKKKIKEYFENRGDYSNESPLFEGKNGGPISRNWFWFMVKQYAKYVGLPADVSPHTIRHSFATHLLEGGADIKTVQALLGHKMISSTQIYTKVTSERKKEVISRHPGS